ncbi:hypothetical protein HDK64DRAFT_263437 [Phyllosticta capitalensis]
MRNMLAAFAVSVPLARAVAASLAGSQGSLWYLNSHNPGLHPLFSALACFSNLDLHPCLELLFSSFSLALLHSVDFITSNVQYHALRFARSMTLVSVISKTKRSRRNQARPVRETCVDGASDIISNGRRQVSGRRTP